jgi:Zn-dependent protease
MALLLGMWERDLLVTALWVGIVLLSVLLHELGHATAGLAFGLEPRIDLHGMGGTTSWGTGRKLATAQLVSISLAGPFAGFFVAAVVYWLLGPRRLPRFHGDFVYETLLYVNVRWGLLNLLPMLPLDGGNVMAQLLNAVTRGRGARPARVISLLVAAISAAVAARFQNWWAALLAVSFAASNWRELRALRAAEHE